MLVEGLALKLGAVVVKSILKTWFSDSGILTSLGTELVDISRDRAQGGFEHRAAARMISNLQDKVAQGILPLFERDRSGLEDLALEAVTFEVGLTIDDEQIDATLLAKLNYEPEALEALLISSRPLAPGLFSNAQRSLYEKLIATCSQWIVRIAAGLPGFQIASFGELLRRDEQITRLLTNVLTELASVRIRSQGAESNSSAEFEERYRRAVSWRLSQMELFGVNLPFWSRTYSLSIAYVGLRATRTEVSPNTRDTSAFYTAAPFKSQQSTGTSTTNISAMLASTTRLLVRGPAGSGKTTLLQWVAVQAALGQSDALPYAWAGRVPFFVRLREFVDKPLPKPQDLLEFVAPQLGALMPHNWIHEQLDKGRAILLVDGIDELPERQYQEVYNWLEDMTKSFSNTCFLVSSRHHTIPGGWLLSQRFLEADLEEMDPTTIAVLIDRWHAAVCEASNGHLEEAELDGLARRLKSKIRATPRLRNLAANPLLCALLCALHQSTNEELPQDRLRLYNACCEMLLERRDVERKIDAGPVPSLSQKILLLQDIAVYLLRGSRSEIASETVIHRIGTRISNMTNLSEGTTAKGTYDFFVRRSGLLREPAAQTVEFTHRTFLEYFAAQALIADDAIDEMCVNATREQWREVIILAAGLAFSRKTSDKLIGGLLTIAEANSEQRKQLELLAVACLETVRELAPELKTKLEERLHELVPPLSIADAVDLAAGGPVVVPYLKDNGTNGVKGTVASIRTLSLIGSEDALRNIALYASKSEMDEAILAELIRAWDYFDRDEYAKVVLPQVRLPQGRMDVERIPQISGLELVPGLVSLRIRDCSNLQDLTGLGTIPTLRDLNLTHRRRSADISFLSTMTHLEHLTLAGFPVNLALLAHLVGLRSLSLIDSDVSPNFALLRGLTELESLSIVNCPHLRNLKSIPHLSNLRFLDIHSNKNLTYLTGITELSHLSELDISHCAAIRDFEILARVRTLTKLTVSVIMRVPKDVLLAIFGHDYPMKVLNKQQYNYSLLIYTLHGVGGHTAERLPSTEGNLPQS